MTAAMLSLGATVVSVEPQHDLAMMINATAELNCWSARSTVLNTRACALQDDSGCMGLHPIDKYAWRRGGGVWWPAILPAVHGTRLDHVLFSGLRRESTPLPLHLDLIKADGDGPEGLWLDALYDLIDAGTVSLGAAVLEGNHLKPETLARLQSINFDVYRVDSGVGTHGTDKRRLLTPDGWDLFSPSGTIARIDRVRSLARDPLEHEMFAVVRNSASASALRAHGRTHPHLTPPTHHCKHTNAAHDSHAGIVPQRCRTRSARCGICSASDAT